MWVLVHALPHVSNTMKVCMSHIHFGLQNMMKMKICTCLLAALCFIMSLHHGKCVCKQHQCDVFNMFSYVLQQVMIKVLCYVLQHVMLKMLFRYFQRGLAMALFSFHIKGFGP